MNKKYMKKKYILSSLYVNSKRSKSAILYITPER